MVATVSDAPNGGHHARSGRRLISIVRPVVTLTYVGGCVSTMKVPPTEARPPTASMRSEGVAVSASVAFETLAIAVPRRSVWR